MTLTVHFLFIARHLSVMKAMLVSTKVRDPITPTSRLGAKVAPNKKKTSLS